MRFIVCLALASLPALAHAAEPAAAPAAAAPLQSVAPEHRGAPFTTTAKDTVSLAQIAATAEQMNGKTVRIDATVTSVCKKKGCWMGVKDAQGTVARVTFKDYAFFLPKNAMGGKVDIEGVLTEREMSQDEAQHYADDAAKAGEAPRKVTGPVKAYQIMATGADLSLVK